MGGNRCHCFLAGSIESLKLHRTLPENRLSIFYFQQPTAKLSSAAEFLSFQVFGATKRLFLAFRLNTGRSEQAGWLYFRYHNRGTDCRMSLKAKLEAVIYAAEEPVTLAQLAALFAADALEWKAEQEAASAAEAAAPASLLPLASSLIDELDYLDQDSAPAIDGEASAAEPVAEIVSKQDSGPSLETTLETGAEVRFEMSSESAAATEGAVFLLPKSSEFTEVEPITGTPEESEAETESEIKRQARQRDREVRAVIRQLLDEIIADYISDERGVEIREIAGGYRMATKPECHDAVRLFVKSLKPPLKLSLAALETLAVIAYKQPVTSPEVNEIRGVESAGVLGSLLARKLIATAGRKQVIGRPILYKTTKEFLLRFGLKNVAELPSMEEFEKLAAIDLDEPEDTADEEREIVIEGEEDDEQEASSEEESASESGPTPSALEEAPDFGIEVEDKDLGLPNAESNAGAAPASAETSAKQQSEAAEIDAETGAEIDVAMPAPMPAVMAAQEIAETPAVTAAEDSAANEVPVEA
jgi:segregation and condensation protein B